jgi:hypothetical protein
VRSQPQQQQQQQQQRVQGRPSGVKERLSLRRAQALQQQQQQQQQDRENGGAAGSAARGKTAAAAAAAAMMPASDHPLATAVMNSSRLLERKMQVWCIYRISVKQCEMPASSVRSDSSLAWCMACTGVASS